MTVLLSFLSRKISKYPVKESTTQVSLETSIMSTPSDDDWISNDDCSETDKPPVCKSSHQAKNKRKSSKNSVSLSLSKLRKRRRSRSGNRKRGKQWNVSSCDSFMNISKSEKISKSSKKSKAEADEVMESTEGDETQIIVDQLINLNESYASHERKLNASKLLKEKEVNKMDQANTITPQKSMESSVTKELPSSNAFKKYITRKNAKGVFESTPSVSSKTANKRKATDAPENVPKKAKCSLIMKDKSVNSSADITSNKSNWDEELRALLQTTTSDTITSASKTNYSSACTSVCSTPRKGGESRNSMSLHDNEMLPPPVLEMMQSGIDDIIDRKAQKNKLNTKQVKSIIKSIVSNEDVIAMLKSSLMPEEEGELISEPRFTRGKLKDVDVDAAHAPIPTISTVEFPEDEDDEEYKPGDHTFASDEEDSILSTNYGASEASPCSTITRPSPFTSPKLRTPISKQRTPTFNSSNKKSDSLAAKSVMNRTHGIIPKALNFENMEAPDEVICNRTRSKLPLTDIPLEVLDKQLNPPDYIPDTVVDNPKESDHNWDEFIQVLTQQIDFTKNDEDDNDPDFVYHETNFEPEDIYEEIRFDKVARITKKERKLLINENINLVYDNLIDRSSGACDDEIRDCHKSFLEQKSLRKRECDFVVPAPAYPTYGKEEYEPITRSAAQTYKEANKVEVEEKIEAPSTYKGDSVLVEVLHAEFTVEQLTILNCQMMQHCQLLATSVMISHDVEGVDHVVDGSINMLKEMEQQGKEHAIPGSSLTSFFHPPNLKPALCAVNRLGSLQYDESIRNCSKPVKKKVGPRSYKWKNNVDVRKKSKQSGNETNKVKKTKRKPRGKNPKKEVVKAVRHSIRGFLKPLTLRVMLNSSAFPFPDLLPVKPFTPESKKSKLHFTLGEDRLISQCIIDHFKFDSNKFKDPTKRNHKLFHKQLNASLGSLCRICADNYCTARTPSQIHARIMCIKKQSFGSYVCNGKDRYRSPIKDLFEKKKYSIDVPSAPVLVSPFINSVEPVITFLPLRDVNPENLHYPWKRIITAYQKERVKLNETTTLKETPVDSLGAFYVLDKRKSGIVLSKNQIVPPIRQLAEHLESVRKSKTPESETVIVKMVIDGVNVDVPFNAADLLLNTTPKHVPILPKLFDGFAPCPKSTKTPSNLLGDLMEATGISDSVLFNSPDKKSKTKQVLIARRSNPESFTEDLGISKIPQDELDDSEAILPDLNHSDTDNSFAILPNENIHTSEIVNSSVILPDINIHTSAAPKSSVILSVQRNFTSDVTSFKTPTSQDSLESDKLIKETCKGVKVKPFYQDENTADLSHSSRDSERVTYYDFNSGYNIQKQYASIFNSPEKNNFNCYDVLSPNSKFHEQTIYQNNLASPRKNLLSLSPHCKSKKFDSSPGALCTPNKVTSPLKNMVVTPHLLVTPNKQAMMEFNQLTRIGSSVKRNNSVQRKKTNSMDISDSPSNSSFTSRQVNRSLCFSTEQNLENKATATITVDQSKDNDLGKENQTKSKESSNEFCLKLSEEDEKSSSDQFEMENLEVSSNPSTSDCDHTDIVNNNVDALSKSDLDGKCEDCSRESSNLDRNSDEIPLSKNSNVVYKDEEQNVQVVEKKSLNSAQNITIYSYSSLSNLDSIMLHIELIFSSAQEQKWLEDMTEDVESEQEGTYIIPEESGNHFYLEDIVLNDTPRTPTKTPKLKLCRKSMMAIVFETMGLTAYGRGLSTAGGSSGGNERGGRNGQGNQENVPVGGSSGGSNGGNGGDGDGNDKQKYTQDSGVMDEDHHEEDDENELSSPRVRQKDKSPPRQRRKYAGNKTPIKIRSCHSKGSPLKKIVTPILRKYKKLSPSKHRLASLSPASKRIRLSQSPSPSRLASTASRLASTASKDANIGYSGSYLKWKDGEQTNSSAMKSNKLLSLEEHLEPSVKKSGSYNSVNEKEGNEEHLEALLKAASTIVKRKGSLSSRQDGISPRTARRIPKEFKVMQANINALSSPPDPDTKNKLFANFFLNRFITRFSDDQKTVQDFFTALHQTMSKSVPVTEIYRKVTENILKDHMDLATEFIGFLTPSQAIEIGKYEEYCQQQRLLDLLYQLHLLQQKQPSVLHKIIRRLAAYHVYFERKVEEIDDAPNSTEKGLQPKNSEPQFDTPEAILKDIGPLLRNPLLYDSFKNWLPGAKSTIGLESDFELVDLDNNDPDGMELIDMGKDYPPTESTKDRTVEENAKAKCPCSCHNNSNEQPNNPTGDTNLSNEGNSRKKTPIIIPMIDYCQNCGLKFIDGRAYYQCGKSLCPADILPILPPESENSKSETSELLKPEEPEPKRSAGNRKSTTSSTKPNRRESETVEDNHKSSKKSVTEGSTSKKEVSKTKHVPDSHSTSDSKKRTTKSSTLSSTMLTDTKISISAVDQTEKQKVKHNEPATQSKDTVQPSSSSSVVWTKEEDLEVLLCCQELGNCEEAFVYIARKLTKKTPEQIQERLNFLMAFMEENPDDEE